MFTILVFLYIHFTVVVSSLKGHPLLYIQFIHGRAELLPVVPGATLEISQCRVEVYQHKNRTDEVLSFDSDVFYFDKKTGGNQMEVVIGI